MDLTQFLSVDSRYVSLIVASRSATKPNQPGTRREEFQQV